MITRTIFVPANQLGRSILEYIWSHVSCSMGEIRKADYGATLSVAITMPERELVKVERILLRFDLM